jgi:hypothetical protein
MTKSRKSTTLGLYFSGAVLALTLAGCASGPGFGRSPEDVVRQRSTERAEAFAKGDFDRSYALTAPSYRKLRDLDAYKRGFGPGAQWQKAEVKSVSCEPERCKVAISVNVKPLVRGKFGDTITVQFEETWLLEDGNWWLHQGL